MNTSLRYIIQTLLLSLSAMAVMADNPTLSLTRAPGATLHVIAEYPSGQGPFPVVILASGSGYHMQQPLQVQTAAALLQQGFAVLRFDWAYRVADPEKGVPSNDRRAEVADLNHLLHWARTQKNLDSQRIILAGKSLGSIVSWEVFRQQPDILAALLLTPVCNDRGAIKRSAETLYPGLADEQRPSLWLIGERDPVCSLARLYRFAAHSPEAARVITLGGDHSFEGIPDSAETLQFAAHMAAYFARRHLP